MKKPKFSIAQKDERLAELVRKTDHKTLGRWALECAERVMPYFEREYPNDPRPRQALDTLQAWIDTGAFKMAVIRAARMRRRVKWARTTRPGLPPGPRARPWRPPM